MIAIGYLVGFRVQTNIIGLLGGMAVMLFFGFSLTWIFAIIGLSTTNAESAQAASFPILAPLVFASSAFVVVATMPGWLQGFANEQPMTLVVNAMRSLAEGKPYPLNPALWQSLAWLAGVIIVFVPLAVRSYRKVS